VCCPNPINSSRLPGQTAGASWAALLGGHALLPDMMFPTVNRFNPANGPLLPSPKGARSRSCIPEHGLFSTPKGRRAACETDGRAASHASASLIRDDQLQAEVPLLKPATQRVAPRA